MRTVAYVKKAFLENLREWKVVLLAVTFAPAFMVMMSGYSTAASPAYRLEVVDHDASAASRELVATWREAHHADGAPVFIVEPVPAVESGVAKVKAREAELVVEIPPGFGASLDRPGGDPLRLRNHADERNLRAAMAMTLSDYHAFTYAAQRSGVQLPVDVEVVAVGGARVLTEFESYVPALLALAIIMVLFTSATALVKEVDRGTITRLMLSRLRTGELLAAVSLNQVLFGVVALMLAYVAAVACGYQSQGSLVALAVVGAAGSLSVVAISVLVAAFLKSMFELLTVGVFPFFVLMFFSEAMFPLPKLQVATLGGHAVYANDVLPTTLCVRAFDKILSFGAPLSGVAFELTGIAVLTALYFVVGTALFRRRHLAV